MRVTGVMYLHEIEERTRTYRPRVLVPYPLEERGNAAREAFNRYLWRRDLDASLARLNGWYPSFDAGDDAMRIVIPATNTGEFPYWQARAVQNDVEPRYQSPNIPREDSVVIVWPEGKRPLLGMAGLVVVVEGPMDALAAAGTGVVGVALMGALPPASVYALIARKFPGALHLVIPDQDQRGAGARTVRSLAQLGRIAQLRLLPDGVKDLAELAPSERERLILG